MGDGAAAATIRRQAPGFLPGPYVPHPPRLGVGGAAPSLWSYAFQYQSSNRSGARRLDVMVGLNPPSRLSTTKMVSI